MSDLDVLVRQMATDIYDHTLRLEDVRLRLFLKWLTAHTGRIQVRPVAGEEFKSALLTWLSCLTVQGALWEYHLILDEIAWWRDLDSYRLKMILKSEAGQ